MLFPTHVRGTWYVKSSRASGLSFVNLLQPPPGSENLRWLLPRWSPTSEGPLCPHSSDGLCKAASWWKQNWVRPGHAQVKPQVKRGWLLLQLIPWRGRYDSAEQSTEKGRWENSCVLKQTAFLEKLLLPGMPFYSVILNNFKPPASPPPIAISSCEKPSLILCSQSTWHNS